MSGIRTQVLAGVLSLLNTSRPSGIPLAVRASGEDFEPALGPTIEVLKLRERVDQAGKPRGPIVKRLLVLAIECRASTGDAAGAPDDATEALTDWVTAKLGGQRIGGLVHILSEAQITWQLRGADYKFCLATVHLVAEYQTKIDDATLKA